MEPAVLADSAAAGDATPAAMATDTAAPAVVVLVEDVISVEGLAIWLGIVLRVPPEVVAEAEVAAITAASRDTLRENVGVAVPVPVVVVVLATVVAGLATSLRIAARLLVALEGTEAAVVDATIVETQGTLQGNALTGLDLRMRRKKSNVQCYLPFFLIN